MCNPMTTRQLYIIIMIYCVSDNKRLHTTALDAKNVALGKNASISSTYPDSGPASLAVDGNTGTTYASVSSGHPNCIHTADNDHNAWWEVDLGRNYTVTNITVYIRDDQPQRMDNVRITVDGKECCTFPSGTTSTPPAKSVSCTSNAQGSVVRFSRNTSDYYLNFCEVQVWGVACSCSSGCNFTQSCIPAGNCQQENVALGKPASMSSSDYSSGPACVAVNGNTGTTYLDTSHENPNCIHTSNGRNEWWEVYLGRNYTITNITVYIRKDQPGRMDNVRITVDGKDCHNFPPGTTNAQEAKSISCTSPVQGSVVKLSRNTSDYFLNFCEVQVWVCRPGLYGKDCESQCNCKNNTVCDNYHGSCAAGCSTGYYGSNCTQKCGRCKVDSMCDSTTGHCLEGCQAGWKEPMCFECKEGIYGAICNQTCGKCINSLCNASDGVCPEGCQDGFEPPFCNETCRKHTYGQNCSLQCGRCNKSVPCDAITGNCILCEANFQLPKCIDCSNGYYGSNCTKECGNCHLGTTCNTTNGHCMSGCKTGWEEPMCIACRKKTYGQKCSMQCGRCNNSSPCDVFNGSCTMCESNFHLPMCTECIHGYYGTNCSIQCGHCKEGQMCNNSNGVCPAGCEDGYELPQCHQIGCSNRMYGPNCSIVCGHCLAVRSCNAINGACPDGCDAGYNTTLCNEKCSSGTWGRNCENACGACLGSICRHDNGICEKGCFSGYDGEHCTVLLQHTNDRDLTGVIAGSVVGAGLLIGGSIVTAVLIWLRRSTMKDKPCPQPSLEDKETHGTPKDTLAMEKVNFHENAYDKLETQEDVVKPYEMLGKEIHVDNVMQSQYQNTSYDSKPYEII